MAAARVIPREEAVRTITYDYNGSTLTVSAPAIMIGSTDQVNFSSSLNSTGPIVITFAANPPVPNPPGPTLFNNITLLRGETIGQVPQAANGSVNYTATAGGQTFGPYAIQVGAGPLYVQINNSNTIPDPAVIPKGGTLEMYSTDGVTYGISWPSTGDPFPTPPPGLTTVNPGVSNNIPYTETSKVAIYAYSLAVLDKLGIGGGKVIVTN
jgi:hypothetical protein